MQHNDAAAVVGADEQRDKRSIRAGQDLGVALRARDLRAHLGCPDDVTFDVDFTRERVIVVREHIRWTIVVATDELVVLYHPPFTPPGCPGVQGIAQTEEMERNEASIGLVVVPRSIKPLATQSCYRLDPQCSQIAQQVGDPGRFALARR